MYLYLAGVAAASLFSAKVRKMWRGQRRAVATLRSRAVPGGRYVWFHAASLGEFEQGRPLMEAIRAVHPEYRILLTFFSPSGYEVRKDYPGADIVCYLPVDTLRNARRFLGTANPEMAFFIKYEFWYNYMHTLSRRGTPVYSASCIFRPGQVFFRWYGRQYARVLGCVTRFFVQDRRSAELLASIGFHNAEVTGDTRFDRVLQIRDAARHLPVAAAFAKGARVMVAGSTWPPDEDILAGFFNTHPGWKLIVAPHVTSPGHIADIAAKLGGGAVSYTKCSEEEAARARYMVVDCIGLLSSVYRYGCAAYVGGGFGVGIHNVLEAAVWGVPVVFGPNNRRFREARGLIAAGGGVEISSPEGFETAMGRIDAAGMEMGAAAARYVESLAGATGRILRATGLAAGQG